MCGAGGGGFMLGFTQDWNTTREKLKDYKLELIYRY
jgi:mevalonate kinase